MDDKNEAAGEVAAQSPQADKPPAQPQGNWGDDERAEGVEDGRAERPTDLSSPDGNALASPLQASPWTTRLD